MVPSELVFISCVLVGVSYFESSYAKNADNGVYELSSYKTNDILNLNVESAQNFMLDNSNKSAVEQCSDTHKCANGGTCLNQHCICPPRTSGLFCEEVYVVCYTYGYDQTAGYRGLGCCCFSKRNGTVECKYDVKTHNAYCECPKESEVYDDKSSSCKECNCGKSSTWTKCEFINGVKTCSCIKNYEYNSKNQICEPCTCGDGSKKCQFSWSGQINCNCIDGYQQWNNSCQKCDCGQHGYCELRQGDPICHCDAGFQEMNGVCKKCNCGKYGKCKGTPPNVYCSCDSHYEDNGGKCQRCYCGEGSYKCDFNSTNGKECTCLYGYQAVDGFCISINMCEQSKYCFEYEKCVTIPGDTYFEQRYMCECKDGLQRNGLRDCKDINECELRNPCTGDEKECVNTYGSFECVCKSGYYSRGGSQNVIVCQRETAKNVGYGVLSALFATITIGLIVLLYKKSRIFY